MRTACFRLSCALLALSPLLAAPPPGPWLRLRTPHFELFTTASESDARACMGHFERLRRFFLARATVAGDETGTVRVIAFRTPGEYAPYRLHDNTDGYYVGNGVRDYIVMASTGDSQLSAAAHEYAHLIARHQGLALPFWLAEGMAEVFSTVRFESGQAVIGAPPPARLRQLRTTPWLPLADLLAARDTHSLSAEQGSLFYAESWALTHMLMFSPSYSSRLGGAPAYASLEASPALEADLHAWVNAPRWPSIELPSGGDADAPVTVEAIAPFDAQVALADVLTASQRYDQAWAAWIDLETIRPANPDIQAALGRIAFARQNTAEARARFQRALALGIRDARVCADYGQLAEDAGFPENEIRAAFERALAVDPAFEDAHFHLALLDMHASRYSDALPHFQALRHVPEPRAFAYYIALADTQIELGLRQDAARSIAEARKHARTDDEHTLADSLDWMAESEVAVQLSPDGRATLRRVPLADHGASGDVNPFIAPGDRIERQEGTLEKVDCGEKVTRLTVRLAARLAVLTIPDPGRVQIRKSGGGVFEFTCGKQPRQRVLVEYAVSPDPASGVAGVLRGIEFH